MEIARHEGFREIRIVPLDGQLQLGCFMREARERFDVGLEPWPAEPSVDMGNLELGSELGSGLGSGLGRGLGHGLAGTL